MIRLNCYRITSVKYGYTNIDEPFPERSNKQIPQKKELSLRAADFITDGDIIGIDSGSTAVVLAEAILERFSVLTVITHSYDVFEILRRQPGFSVILCGGCYLPSENVFCGALTLDMLSHLHMQKAFLFPSAICLGNVRAWEKKWEYK